MRKPTRIRSEVGAIKSFRSYSIADRRKFSVEQAARWLSNPRTGSAYYVETFVSWKAIANRPSEGMQRRGALALQQFENELKRLQLPITVTRVADKWVSASVYVIKVDPAVAVDAAKAMHVHQALLSFLDNQAVVKSILLPPVLQSARLGGEPKNVPVIPAPEAGRTYPVLGIVDSGVTNLPQLAAWQAGSCDFVAAEEQDVSHGTFIAGLVCAGDVLNTDPVFDETRCKFFDLDLHPTVEGSYGNYYPRGFIDFLEQLDAEIPAAKQEGVRVFNMSLAVETPVADDGYSLFATMLDEIADKHDVLFILPAGNLRAALARDPWPENETDAVAMVAAYRFAGQDRIFQPADSIRSIVVGALDPRAADGRFVPSRYTRRGPGPSLGAKPDIAHIGGRYDLHSGLRSLAPNGAGLEDCGTSYAAPLAAKTVAALDHAIEGRISREALMALTVHHAQVPENLRNDSLRPFLRDFVGAGLPRPAIETLLVNDHEITLVFNGVMMDGHELVFPFTWPASLVNINGACTGNVRLTVVHRPPTDRAFGGEFVRVNLDAYLRQEVVNSKTNKVSFKGRLKGDGAKRFEKELVEHGAKWWPVKILEGEFDELGGSSQWRLVIDSLARSGTTLPPEGVPFSAVLTISDPSQAKPIFNEMRLQLQNAGTNISDIRSALRPRVR
ncbi:S8 family peptidase [Cupriavidus basilensis]